MLIVLFVSIYTTRVVISALGIEDFGVYNVVCGFVSMFSFLNASMTTGIQRFYNYETGTGDPENVTKIYRTALIIQILIAFVLFIVLETIGLWYVNTKMVLGVGNLIPANTVFQCSTISFVFVILQIPYSAAILAHECMDYYSLVSIVDIFLKLLIVLILPCIPDNRLIFYGFLQLIVSIGNFFAYYVYAKKKFKELKFSKIIDKELFKSIFSFSGWNVFNMFAWMTQGQGINMLINLFFGPVVNAARGVSGQIQAAIQGFCENLVIAFRPQLVLSYSQGNFNRTSNMMESMSKVMFIMFLLLSNPIIFNIDYILKLWLGNDIPEYTAPFVILILLSMYPRNFTMAFTQVVHATGKLKNYELASSIVILLVLPLSYLVLRLGGNVISVFWINLAICSVAFVVSLIFLHKVFPLNIKHYCRNVILPCLMLGIMSLIVPILSYLLIQTNTARFLSITVLGSVFNLVFAYLFVLNNDERNLMLTMLKNKFCKKRAF